MSTEHYVHEILAPGLDGDGFTAVEAAQIRDEIENYGEAVGRIDPGAVGPVGASLSQGPNGPAWRNDAVDASWFSNPNDAIAAAGPGGKVLFRKNTTYWLPDALKVTDGIEIIGEDRATTILRYNGGSNVILRAEKQGTEATRRVKVSGVTLHGGWVAEVLLDARDMTDCTFEDIQTNHVGPNGVSVWFGGDNGVGGWSNKLWRSELRAGNPGTTRATILFHGRSGVGRTGPESANNMSIIGNQIYSSITLERNESFAIDIQEGWQNHFAHNDIGYNPGGGIRFGPRGSYNSFIDNRMENVPQAVLIEGGRYNRVIANHLHQVMGHTEINTILKDGAERNIVAFNTYQGHGSSLKVQEQDTARGQNTIVSNQGSGDQKYPLGTTNLMNSGNNPALTIGRGEEYPRFMVEAGGRMRWGTGASYPNDVIERNTPGIVGTHDNTKWKAGNGAWDSGHLIMGTYHFWVDTSGRLRIKNGSPASDTDGTVVGSQS